ncbi:MAG: extracellular solute-binding protein [Myxococcales bacterium]|nr:extracellular solute-binding protein [Myxococcales bacterium]
MNRWGAGLAFLWAAAALGAPEVTLTLVVPQGPEAGAHLRLSPLYEAETRGRVHVEVRVLPRAEHADRTGDLLARGSGEVDVLSFSCSSFDDWRSRGFLEPLDASMNEPSLFDAEEFDLEDFLPAISAQLRHRNTRYGFPQEVSGHLLFYRKDLLRAHGVAPPPPRGWSWSELREAAQKLRDGMGGAGREEKWAIGFPGADRQSTTSLVLHNAWARGARVMEDEALVASDEVIDSLEDYTALVREKLAPPETASWQDEQAREALGRGRVAMALQPVSAAAELLDPQRSPVTAGQLGFSVFPWQESKGPDQLRLFSQCLALGVSRFSEHKREAFSYVTWFTSRRIARDYVMRGGGASGRRSLLGDARVIAANPAYKALGDGARLLRTPPSGREWTWVLEKVLPALFSEAIAGRTKPRQAAERADAEIRARREATEKSSSAPEH